MNKLELWLKPWDKIRKLEWPRDQYFVWDGTINENRSLNGHLNDGRFVWIYDYKDGAKWEFYKNNDLVL